ncbi:MAG: Xylose isomerase-like TIM barrel [Firmicutes bacterium ADurb.Bin300]|nr:MAG: Xylose isomerase-like TIM barrel [Firmicutes bacterium ADurb.Bin300]HOD02115.1 TIM barrel protein [Clostridiales bacterium]
MANFLLSAFADEAGGGILDQIDALKANKLTHIEPRGLDEGNISEYTPGQAKELKKILDENEIGVSAIGSRFGKIGIDDDDFEEHFEEFKSCVEVANILGTKRIRMFSFFFSEDVSKQEYRDEVFERIDRMCDYSLRSGVWCCHENEKHIYGENDTECLDLLSTFKGKLLGVFDPANFIQCGTDVLSAYDLLEEYINYLHIKDCLYEGGKVRPAGKGDGKIVELLKRFNNKDGERFLTLEPHLKVFKGLDKLEAEGGQAEKLKNDYTYSSNREAFDAAANALWQCLAQADCI